MCISLVWKGQCVSIVSTIFWAKKLCLVSYNYEQAKSGFVKLLYLMWSLTSRACFLLSRHLCGHGVDVVDYYDPTTSFRKKRWAQLPFGRKGGHNLLSKEKVGTTSFRLYGLPLVIHLFFCQLLFFNFKCLANYCCTHKWIFSYFFALKFLTSESLLNKNTYWDIDTHYS